MEIATAASVQNDEECTCQQKKRADVEDVPLCLHLGATIFFNKKGFI